MRLKLPKRWFVLRVDFESERRWIFVLLGRRHEESLHSSWNNRQKQGCGVPLYLDCVRDTAWQSGECAGTNINGRVTNDRRNLTLDDVDHFVLTRVRV